MRWSSFAGALLMLVLPALDVGAAAIPAKYTATDLGLLDPNHPNDKPLIDASGRSVVVTADGKTAYPFPQTSISAPDSLLQSFAPQFPKNPADYYSFSDVSRNPGQLNEANNVGQVNVNGIVTGQVLSGVSGHTLAAESQVFAAQRQPDGTYGPVQVLWTSPTNRYGGGTPAQAFGINIQDVVLGQSGYLYSYDRSALLYNVDTKELLTLPSQIGRWDIDIPRAIDDQGRLLFVGNTADQRDHVLLLTPEGVSSDPIATPEPSTLAILGVGAAGAWWHRRRARRAA